MSRSIPLAFFVAFAVVSLTNAALWCWENKKDEHSNAIPGQYNKLVCPENVHYCARMDNGERLCDIYKHCEKAGEMKFQTGETVQCCNSDFCNNGNGATTARIQHFVVFLSAIFVFVMFV
ncbi:hypothetical protein AAVH_08869 [Aphelenchoides avenae]|nr:hypothetical protein AAVH_08869 [Aphelenchus avenae]